MVCEIPLTQGYVALVDDCEYERCARHNWCAAVSPGTVYGTRGFYVDGKYVRIFLHRFILGLPDGISVDHADGDGLNNTYANLRAASTRQNQWNKRRRPDAPPVGVTKYGSVFRATVSIDGRPQSFGTFETEAEASRVYDAAIVRLRGAFAQPNDPVIDSRADKIAADILAGGVPLNCRSAEYVTNAQMRRERAAAIRRRYAEGDVLGRDLASEYRLSVPAVHQILRGIAPIDLEPDGLQAVIDGIARRNKGSGMKSLASRNRKLTDSQVEQIRRRYQPRVVTAKALADEYGVTASAIYSIVGGYSWKAEAA